MFKYIQINDENICIGYKTSTFKNNCNNFILIDNKYNLNDLLYRKYDIETNTFSEEKYFPIVEEMPTWQEEMEKKISILECENKALKEELTQIQTSIASLTSLITATLEEK